MVRFGGQRFLRVPGAAAVVSLIVSVVAGCSGSDPAPATVPSSTSVVAAVAPTSTSLAPEPTPPTVPIVPPSVRIDVSVAGSVAELSGLLVDATDPFGEFVSCSGLRSSFGSYSVLASTSSGDVRSISVVSADRVPGPGVYDAAVRVEFGSRPAVDATGTISVGNELRTGSFVAFDADGMQVGGSFGCLGGENDPEPLEVGGDDGLLEVVEVFALLRSGDAQRLLGLAARADAAATVECPGADGGTGESPSGVRVIGDDTIGAITRFELGDGPTPSLRFRAGTVDYSFDQVTRSDADPAAGSFRSESNGTTVDGAFRCS